QCAACDAKWLRGSSNAPPCGGPGREPPHSAVRTRTPPVPARACDVGWEGSRGRNRVGRPGANRESLDRKLFSAWSQHRKLAGPAFWGPRLSSDSVAGLDVTGSLLCPAIAHRERHFRLLLT